MLKEPRMYLKELVKDAFPEIDISLEKLSDEDCKFMLETVIKRLETIIKKGPQ